MESDNRFLTIGEVARATNNPKSKIEEMILFQIIPPFFFRTINGETRLHAGIVTAINDSNAGWLGKELEQPANAIHVEDPDGVYPGFWLTPEQALTLAEIRVTKRLTGRMANDMKATIGILQDERRRCLRDR